MHPIEAFMRRAGASAPSALTCVVALLCTLGSARAAESSPYDPPWADVAPLKVLTLDYASGSTPEQNGMQLLQTVWALQPGDMLRVAGGVYSVPALFVIDAHGTSDKPIWIVAQDGATPVITRPDANQNALNIGNIAPAAPASYLCVRGFEITGGDIGVMFRGCSNVWLDRCHVHHVNAVGLYAGVENTEFLYLTRNTIHHTGGTAEGMYLGANDGVKLTHHSVVALNHVYATKGTQRDGIELKQGSYANWIVRNYVHDCQYPCILVYGTSGKTPNRVEANICHGSLDNVMQVQGDALVWNNLLALGAIGFESHDHQGPVQNLAFVHNTIVNVGKAVHLANWNGRPNMTCANNVMYSLSDIACLFPSGSGGVALAGNVVLGPVYGASTGFKSGMGLSDFANPSFFSAVPSASGAIHASGVAAYAAPDDLSGALRVPPLESGCFDGP